jgi:hypothetical protein
MVRRRAALAPLGMLLVLASGCPEEDPNGEGNELADTGETGEASSETASDPTGVEGEEDDVRPPPGLEEAGDGDGDPGDGDGDPGDGDGDGEGTVDDPNRCWDDTWTGTVFPHVILGNTTDHFDMFTGGCGDGPSPNWELGFMAPWDGLFAFDTSGSSFDTVVYVHEGECGDEELACNDDFIGLDSRVVVDMKEGEHITVSVDGTGPFEQGLFTLEISEAVLPVCETEVVPPNDLPIILLGDTSDADSQLESGCGGDGAPERVYEFVAPGPGTYRFDTFGSSFDTVLYVLDECDGPPLACNDDAQFDIQSELVLNLAGGKHVLIVVDGHGPDDAGPFLLNVEEIL